MYDAQVIDETTAATIARKGPRPIYPWDQWFDGRPRALELDRLGQARLRSAAYQAAARRGISVSVWTLDDGRTGIQAILEDDETEATA